MNSLEKIYTRKDIFLEPIDYVINDRFDLKTAIEKKVSELKEETKSAETKITNTMNKKIELEKEIDFLEKILQNENYDKKDKGSWSKDDLKAENPDFNPNKFDLDNQ